VTLAEVARQHEISRSMLYDWRYRHKLGRLGCPAPFVRLVPMESWVRPDVAPPLSATPPIVTTIDLGDRCRVTIPADFDMEAAARLLNGLVVVNR
jgi:transposase